MRFSWLFLLLVAACGGSDASTAPRVVYDAGDGTSSSSSSSGSIPPLPDGGAGDDDDSATSPWPHTIAMTIKATSDDGTTAATKVDIALKVGTGPVFDAVFDTGSNGIVALPSAVAPATVTFKNPQQRVDYEYGGAVHVSGLLASAIVTVGDLVTPAPIDFVLVDTINCVAAKPNCPAAGASANTYKFASQFGAIFGVGTRSDASMHPLQSALLQLGAPTSKFVVALGPNNSAPAPKLIIEPDATTVARFTNTITLPSGNASVLANIPSYDDRQVPFCINAFCDQGLLDTGGVAGVVVGTMQQYKQVGAPNGSGFIPGGTAVTESINTTSSWSFTVGTPPVVGVDRIALGTAGNNLGPVPFYNFDVMYDGIAGKISLAAHE